MLKQVRSLQWPQWIRMKSSSTRGGRAKQSRIATVLHPADITQTRKQIKKIIIIITINGMKAKTTNKTYINC